MDREFEAVQKQEQIDRQNNSANMKRDMQLANEVFVFYDKNKPGIKFYDRSPEEGSVEGRLIGVSPKGVYYTYDIEEAEWEDEINRPGETVAVNYLNGSNKVTTIMVTEQEMMEILEEIEEQKQKESKDGMIIVDLRPRIKIKDLAQNSIINNKAELSEIKKFDNLNKLKIDDNFTNIKEDIE